ncbi:Histidinol dehydrogenase, partial [termite gut metagenome]
MQIIEYPDREQWTEILKRPALQTENLFETVQAIINRVKAEGDKAVLMYEAQFDGVQLHSLSVSPEELEEAENILSKELKNALLLAKKNIATFHAAQRFEGKKVETMKGVSCWQKAVAIEKVGLYIPGGTAPLFST